MNRSTSHIWTTLCLFFFLLSPSGAFAQASNSILDLTVSAEISEDGSTKITEAILYDFGATRHHGIFRNLPLFRQEGSALYRYGYSDITVTDKEGNPIPFEQIMEKSFLRLKIGEEQVLISGVMEYRITYMVKNLMRGFDAYDEWVWDVTSSNWPLSIRRSRLNVRFPKELSISSITRSCVTLLVMDSQMKESCQVGFIDRTPENTTQSIQLMDLNLQSREPMLVVLGFPKGMFTGIPEAKEVLTAPKVKMNFAEIVSGTLMLMLVGTLGRNFLGRRKPQWIKE